MFVQSGLSQQWRSLARRLGVRMVNGAKWSIPASVVIGLCASAPTNAAMTTYHVAFSANAFQIGAGADPAPVDPVLGDFTVTLDPAVAVANQTAGIALNSLNIALGSAISFTYDPAADGGFAPGTLRVGGIASGPDVIVFGPSTDDFWLFIPDFAGAATFQQLGYTQTAVSSRNLFFTINQTGTVQVSIIPEPAAALCLVGLAALRRRCRA